MKEFTWRRWFVRFHLSRPVFTFEFGRKKFTVPYKVYGFSIGSHEMCHMTNTGSEGMRTKQQAEKEGRKLLELIDEDGWEMVIWENIGWHYKAVNGYLSVYPSVDGKYFASLGTEPRSSSTPGYWVDKGHYDDPMEAVIAQIRKAAGFTGRCQMIVSEALSAISRTPEDLSDV